MSIYFSINDNIGIGINSGVSYCIFEETRKLFDASYGPCLDDIYEGYDIGMGVVTFAEVDKECYNYFYRKYKAAMHTFPESSHASGMSDHLIEGIMERWTALLKSLKQDPRYQSD